MAFAQEELKKHHPQSTGSIHFHELDLSSISSTRRSAEEFKKKIGIGEAGNEAGAGRLDIVIGNAGIAFPPQDVLSEDGVERTFAVNCLGHFVFITSLLGTSPLPLTQSLYHSLFLTEPSSAGCSHRTPLMIGSRSHRTDSEQVWRSANNPNLLARLQSCKETRLHRPNDAYPQRWLQIL